jgi:transcriptional regulator with XRE-family HTH domain
MSTALGERLHGIRKARGLSQEAVARRATIGLKAYGDLERGRTSDPHYSTLEDVARALGTTVAELVSEEPVAPLAEERASQEWARHQGARLHGMDSETWDDYLRAHDTVEELGETWKEIYDESGMLHAALRADKWQRPQERERRRKLAQGLRELRMGRYANLQARAMLLHAQALVDEIFAAMSEEANA